MLDWSRLTLAIANPTCATCAGSGTRRAAGDPCSCVLRAIFRIVHGRARAIAYEGGRLNAPRCSPSHSYGRPGEEFRADFQLVSTRALADHPLEAAVFQRHYIDGHEWRESCRLIRCAKGEFFHAVYRLQQLLGRAFAETLPYALYPVAEYFAGVVTVAPKPAAAQILRMPWPRHIARYIAPRAPAALIPPLKAA
jgi:hypothetical protein